MQSQGEMNTCIMKTKERKKERWKCRKQHIELEKEDGNLVNYRIVGPDETDTAKGHISIDSPLAKALLKKQIDDEISIKIANEDTTYCVLSITY